MHKPLRSLMWIGTLLAVLAGGMVGAPARLQAQTAPAPDLAVTHTVSDATPYDGAAITLSVTATNTSPTDAASGVSAALTLPAGLTYQSDTGGGAYASGLWTIGALAPGASAVLDLTLGVDPDTDGLVVTATTTLAGAEPDPASLNNTAATVITVRVNTLCARTGTLALPGATAPILGYSPGSCARPLPAQVPGPVVVVDEGETFSLTLENGLAAATGLHFPGQRLRPDLTGVAGGASRTYTFLAAAPGTFGYEAGLLPNAQHQTVMGMFGALIVRPAVANQAYASAATAYDREAVLVLSELDPALNNAANPAAFDLRNYRPRYGLINGQAFPNTTDVVVGAGERVLVRYFNAGQKPHAMSLLGLRQQLVAVDGKLLPFPSSLVAESLAPGQTADVIITIPSAAPDLTRFALYDADLLLHNNGQRTGTITNLGGMLTFLTLGAGLGGQNPNPPGPTTSAITLAPSLTTGAAPVALTATLSDVGSGDSNIQAAEYFIDTPGANGAGIALAPVDVFDSPTEIAAATLSPATLALLSSGPHTLHVHGLDASGEWGAFSSAVLLVDRAGPATTGLTLTPNPSQGNAAVALSGTGDDRLTGNQNVQAAEYFIDGTGAEAPGTGTPLAINQTAPTASLDATLAAATVQALAEGAHVIAVRSQDVLGNWGPFSTITLRLDRTGPAASNVRAAPNPNTGTQGINPGNPTVRVDATLTDPTVAGAQSTVQRAEGFIDTVGAVGTGFPLTPADGLFDETTEDGYAFVPLTTINALAHGVHQLYVRGRDASGNWGAATATPLIIDKIRPTLSGLTASPNPTAGAQLLTLSATGDGTGSNITAAEWYEGADPGVGRANAMTAADGAFNSATEVVSTTLALNGWTAGAHTLVVRVRDGANQWSLTSSVVVTVVQPDAIFQDSFEGGNTAAWSTATGANLAVTTAARMTPSGTYGLQAAVAGNTPGYVTDNTPANDAAYRARFYFHPNSTVTVSGQQTIFAGRNAAGTTIFTVQYRRTAAGALQLRATVLRAGGTSTTNWFTITNAAHAVEINWASGTAASFQLYIDGTLRQTLTNLNTSAYRVESVRLGPSAGLVAGASGTLYFDAFVSRRNTYVGP